MSLGILNNVAALYAQNNLNNTQAGLQSTLNQLSSGSRINSGSDDPAGLAVADGLHANEAALTQSAQNATDGVGLLQTADGALSQVTNLLDSAVTLATESANGTLTTAQISSANQEYQNILTQIGNIGSTTNFNSSGVFSATAKNLFVSDGTSAGSTDYSDVVGVLTDASVGTTASAAVTTAAVTPTNVAPTPAVTNQPGVYTLTAAGASDTLGGTLSFTLGSGPNAAQTSINVAAGSSLSTIAGQLTSAGLTSTVSSNVITITGPTNGADAAANTVNFNSNLSDTPATTALTSAAGTTAVAGTASTGSLAVASASSGDSIGGTITLTQGTQHTTVTIASGSHFGLATTSGTVQYQLAQQLQGTGFSLGTDTGSAADPTLNFTGANNTTAITVTNTLADATNTGATFTGGTGVGGTANVQGTYTLGALSNSSDTFGSSSANALTINGNSELSIAGLTATQTVTAINADSALQTAGITATVNQAGTQVTIHGNSNGSGLTVTGHNAGPLGNALTDQAPNAAAITTVGVTTQPQGATAAGGTSTIQLGGPNDLVAGTLAITVNTQGSAKSASLVVNPNSNGQALANQINQSTSFQQAGLSASFDTNTNAVTITGPTGAGNTISTSHTALTDTTSPEPGAGVDFTQASVSTLSASTAQSVLTSVTTAIADVAYQRGTIGADVNELTAASNVASSEEVNLTSAEDSVRSTNYGQASSDLSKYQILSQTGISALAQANSVQQEVLKLLQ